MASSQIQQPPLPTTTITIESIESSLQNLIKNWQRRQRWQRWKHVFSSRQQDNLGHHKRAPWRIHLASFLESTPVHVFSICLLLTDLIFTVLELSSSLLSCSTKENKKGETWYHWVGIGILGLLCIKSIALAIALGFSFFWRPGYVVDGAVVIGALFLEAFLEGKGGGLLVVVSLWRVVRVVESVFELSDEAIEAQIEAVLREFEALRGENRRLLEVIGEKDKLIEKLQEELDHCKQACN
ncbi:hypothetical protein CK203_047112 [Vitis vinifera]|uniref:Voltage-gated hydrogen channel 1 n=1 Tax=Vitis vinifera TaxID=29760 RepID=A0A438HDZ1_VITVI|nr:hypothetical protein CK203_090980 [Vitis vinifera]RVW82579.1 hypothetical protein CK203_047112 [Vitis vinifera]